MSKSKINDLIFVTIITAASVMEILAESKHPSDKNLLGSAVCCYLTGLSWGNLLFGAE